MQYFTNLNKFTVLMNLSIRAVWISEDPLQLHTRLSSLLHISVTPYYQLSTNQCLRISDKAHTFSNGKGMCSLLIVQATLAVYTCTCSYYVLLFDSNIASCTL